MEIIETVHAQSGLKVNSGKAFSTIFRKQSKQPEYVAQLDIKWCSSFELLGVQFNQMLSEMDVNYNLCFRKVKDELNSLNFRHLTLFSRLTVIKRLFLPKLCRPG